MGPSVSRIGSGGDSDSGTANAASRKSAPRPSGQSRWSTLRKGVRNMMSVGVAVKAVAAMHDEAELSKIVGVEHVDLDLHNQHKQTARVTEPNMFHPHEKYRRAWDFIAMALVLTTLAFTPFELGFSYSPTLSGTTGQAFWWYVDVFMFLFFACDIALNFRTAAIVDDELVQDPKDVAKLYLKFWFWVDLLATMPSVLFFDMLESLATGDGDSVGSTRVLRFLRFFRLVRLMRMLRILKLKAVLDEMGDAGQVAKTLIKFAQLMFWMVMTGHMVACAWFFIADVNGGLGPNTWAWQFRLDDPETPFTHKYSVSVYWSMVTITTLG